MALVVYDRVQETTATTGTGTLTLGGAVAGFQSFAVVGNGNTTFYCIVNGVDWEVGIGTYSTTGPTLARTTVLSNSLGTTSPITLVGASNVFVTYPSEKSVNQDANGNVNILTYVPNTTTTIGTLNVGDGTYNLSLSGQIASFAGDDPVVNGINVQNTSTSNTAYSAIQVGADNFGTGYYLQIGTNSSTYDYAAAGYPNSSINQPDTHYILANRSDLGIATWDAEDIHFIQNASVATIDSMTLYADGGVSLGGLANPGLGNIACNNINLKFQQILTTGGTTLLTNASPYFTQFTGTSTHAIQLPDATTCLVGTTFVFDNDSTQNVDIKNGTGTIYEVLIPGGYHNIVLEDNSTIAGTWIIYSSVPSTVEWGTNSLVLGSTVITGGFWQGGTVQPAYGGTGLTTFTAANNALYSTSASTLTAGTLPVAAGGTGLTSLTAGYIPFGAGTSPFGSSSSLFWDNTNARLGIGTSSPASSLHVNSGASDEVARFEGTGTPFISLYDSGTKEFALELTATSINLFGQAVKPMVFVTNAVERMRITTAGDIGINTSTPQAYTNYKFITTNGVTGSGLQLRANNTAVSEIYANASEMLLKAVTAIPMTFATNNTERMRIDASGNVGIGTASPSTYGKLAITSGVASTALGIMQSDSTNTSQSIKLGMYTTGAYGTAITAYTNWASSLTSSLSFSTTTGAGALTEAMRIDSSQNVGIGTASPVSGFPLTAYNATNGGIVLQNSTNFTGIAQNGTSVYFDINRGGAAGNLIFRNSSSLTEQMRITTAGAVSFGSAGNAYGASGQFLQSNGNNPPSWTSSISGTSVNIAGNGAGADPYGTIAITEPANANNYSYYGLTRAGQIGAGFGLSGTTGAGGLGANAFWFGGTTAGSAGVLSGNAWIAFSSTAFVANGTVTATNHIGPGTGLTGTATSLSIGGNAATATTANALNTANSYTVAGLTVGNSASSYIYMVDTDEGNRSIHCNSNRIGFLSQAGGWGSYCQDDGSWATDQYFAGPGTGLTGTASSLTAGAANNVAGLIANSYTSYGGTATTTSRNGYYGLLFGTTTSTMNAMFDSGGNGGFYIEGSVGWVTYWSAGNSCFAIGGSATTAGYKLQVNGAIYATGNITAYSDRRKKENIVTIDNALDKVCQMRGVYYNKIDDETKTRQVGVIAQEMQEALPEAVMYSKDNDEYGVSYGNIVGILIEAIKDLKAETVSLKAEIDQLKAR